MSETGGPVYEGVGRPEKSPAEERAKTRVKEVFADFKNKGEYVEKKWMNAYQRVVDALDDGKRKRVLEKAKTVALVYAKGQRIVSSVVDAAFLGFGVKDILSGAAKTSVLNPQGPSMMARGAMEAIVGKKGVARQLSGFMADIAGAGGEKVAQITNKIFSGKPKVGPVAG